MAGIKGRAGEDTGPYEWSIGCAVDGGRTNAQYPQGARRIRKAAKPPTAALCAPLQAVYRSIPIDEGRRAEVVAPYGDLCSNTTTANRHGGLYRTTNNDSTFKFRRQVERGRQSGSCRPQQIQRRGHALKTPSAKQKPPPPRPKHRAKPTRRSTEAAPRPMVLRGTGVRTVPRLRRG